MCIIQGNEFSDYQMMCVLENVAGTPTNDIGFIVLSFFNPRTLESLIPTLIIFETKDIGFSYIIG